MGKERRTRNAGLNKLVERFAPLAESSRDLVRDLCREHGVAEPMIDVSEHWVTVTFPRPAAQDGLGNWRRRGSVNACS